MRQRKRNLDIGNNYLASISAKGVREDNATLWITIRPSERCKGVLLAVLNAYIDEGGTDSASDLLCSAGCVFTKEGSRDFFNAWDPVLKQKNLPYFHTTEHQGQYRQMFVDLAKLTLTTTEQRVVRFVEKTVLNTYLSQSELKKFTGGGYSLVTLSCMEAIASFAKQRNHEVFYMIEAGHSDQAEMSNFLEQIKLNPDLRSHFAYHASDFFKKEDEIQLQSADFLAWLFPRGYKEKKIPGFKGADSFPEWKQWITEHVDASGFSDISIQVRGMINAFLGLRASDKGKNPAKKRPRKPVKPIEPFTEEDFDAVLRKVLRKISPASRSDEAKK